MNVPLQQLCLLFHALPNVGSAVIRQTLAHYASAQDFWSAPAPPKVKGAGDASNAALVDLWRAGDSSEAWQQALEQHARLQLAGIELVSWRDATYPALLKQIPDSPALLYLQGNPDALRVPQLAIVGSRNASRMGIDTASAFAFDLASIGFAVCSGLALGIDGASHRGALAAGGITTAVLGTGVDRVYPQRHTELASEIVEKGVLISEFPLGAPPLRWHFPKRNRLIAGMCQGTLVVEAAPHSGSLITARLALDYNREVFAVPGSIHNPRSKGNHTLIREGAKLVETTDHILEELNGFLQLYSASMASTRPVAATRPITEDPPVLEAIDYHPTPLDVIVERTGMDCSQLAAVLLELEISGRIEACAGAWQRCR